MEPLESPIRGYAWGSRTAIAELQGRPTPTLQPEAELWLGAHPASPSSTGGTPLTELIATDPVGVLGEVALRRFGPRLPFLLKVLAAAEPLSLQAHPDLEQARAGYLAEEEAGVPRGAAHRTYVDAWHKPEMLVAVEEFDALCGFRDPAESAALLARLDVEGLKPTVDALRAADPSVALRDAVRGLLRLPKPVRAPLVAEVVAAAGDDPAYALVRMLARDYPGDVGVIVALLLNRVTLFPGTAVWMPAGNLHAYLRGVGVEIMAASDNVLRGGLTAKHVNVDELLRVLRFEVLDNPLLPSVRVADGLVTWRAPIEDFALHRAVLGAAGAAQVVFPGGGPRIVLCLRGEVVADDGAGPVTLRGGQAAFATAAAGPVTVRGAGEAYQAGTGAQSPA